MEECTVGSHGMSWMISLYSIIIIILLYSYVLSMAVIIA